LLNPAAKPGVVAVTGFAHEPFEPVADIFARLVATQGRGGAALAIYFRGKLIVDLVAGNYKHDSLQLLFSVTKTLTAVAAAMAHSEGLLDLDAPLGDYWPAFRRPATGTITARSVLAHRSGLAAFDRIFSLDELVGGADQEAIEVQEPYWTPNTRHGYHAFTFGTLIDGAFRRVLGRSVGEYVADHIASPLKLDLWIGTPEKQLHRIERISYEPTMLTQWRARMLAGKHVPASPTAQLQRIMDFYNDPAVAQASWPATSGVGGARDLARFMYATMDEVDGVRLLRQDAMQAMVETRSHGPDVTLGVISHFGSGMQRPFPQLPFLGPSSFGHEAGGGSAAVADTELGVAVGYTTNVHPPMSGASTAFLALMPAIRHCVTAGDKAT
jgi:CubicO group peptidase (beta-lactamase class C family)